MEPEPPAGQDTGGESGKNELKLTSSCLFRRIRSKRVKEKQIECLTFASRVFPVMIPIAHHQMYLPGIKDTDGKYWRIATHFLVCSKAHGISMWKRLQKQMRSMDAEYSCRPHDSLNIIGYDEILKPYADVFGSAEFFFEDSVLVQLAFQPVLLFQWLTHTLCSILDFELKMIKFYELPVPSKFESHLLLLDTLLKTTYRHVGYLFDYLQYQTGSEVEIFVGNLKAFEIILAKVLAFHRFRLKERGEELLQNLASKCWVNWGHDSEGGIFRLRRGEIPFKKRNFLFNPDIWIHGPCEVLQIFGSSDENIVILDYTNFVPGKIEEASIPSTLDKYLDLAEKNGINIVDLKQDAQFMEKVRKVEVQKSILSQRIIDDVSLRFLGNVFKTMARIEFESADYEILCYLVDAHGLPPASVVGATSSTDLDYDKITTLIPALNKEPFSFKQTLVNLKESIPKVPGCNCFQPEIDYEVRIRKIVLSCIEGNLEMKNLEERDELLRDWQFAQYILPCFGALYLEICKSEESEYVWWLGKFIDALIKTYEEDGGVRKSSWSNIFRDIQTMSDAGTEINFSELFGSLKKVLKGISSNIKNCKSPQSYKTYCLNFVNSTNLFNVLSEDINKSSNENKKIAPDVYKCWAWLLKDFVDRMSKAMKSADDPNVSSLPKEMGCPHDITRAPRIPYTSPIFYI